MDVIIPLIILMVTITGRPIIIPLILLILSVIVVITHFSPTPNFTDTIFGIITDLTDLIFIITVFTNTVFVGGDLIPRRFYRSGKDLSGWGGQFIRTSHHLSLPLSSKEREADSKGLPFKIDEKMLDR